MLDMEFASSTIEAELEKHGMYASNTRGVSMEPLFRTRRDMVIIEKPKEELKKYDVALYRDCRGKYILHRVIKVKSDEYVIRGDNTYRKEHISKGRIIGVLTAFNRKGKRHSVTDRSYRIYSRVWNFIYPVRCVFHALISLPKRAVKKALRTFFGKKKTAAPTEKQ